MSMIRQSITPQITHGPLEACADNLSANSEPLAASPAAGLPPFGAGLPPVRRGSLFGAGLPPLFGAGLPPLFGAGLPTPPQQSTAGLPPFGAGLPTPPQRSTTGLPPTASLRSLASALLLATLLTAAMLMICLVAPTERSMGDVQRIVYVHVAVAWLGLLGLLVMAGSGIAYLARQDLRFDHWFQAAGELGWLSCSLTLATGSLWAHEAWGTWWVWDPRLTASFVLWLIYSGILLVRGSVEEAHPRARISAILAVLGAIDVPLVVMAARWFRGLHPVSPEMDPTMRATLLVSVVAFTGLFAWLAAHRKEQLCLQERLEELQRESGL